MALVYFIVGLGLRLIGGVIAVFVFAAEWIRGTVWMGAHFAGCTEPGWSRPPPRWREAAKRAEFERFVNQIGKPRTAAAIEDCGRRPR